MGQLNEDIAEVVYDGKYRAIVPTETYALDATAAVRQAQYLLGLAV